MALQLKSLHNDSGKMVHIDIGGKSFDIENDKSQAIDCFIATDGYTKINKSDEHDHAYLLKYVYPNIQINDRAGKSKGVEDCSIQLKLSDEIKVIILKDEMYIKCDGRYLGIYQQHGDPNYYMSVVARHKHNGGIEVVGGESMLVGESTDGPDA